MTDWPDPADQAAQRGPAGVVLVGLGRPGEQGLGGLPPLAQVASRLAPLLTRPLLTLPLAEGPDGDDPDAALLALTAQAAGCPAGWLAALERDVGLPLAEGRCWAEALGAWRQPALLVIPAAQLASGLPAAGTALLHQRQVPLLGLLQWGGTWQEQPRRRDGLPWLGALMGTTDAAKAGAVDDDAPGDEGQPGDAERALAAALALRWSQLDRG